MSFRSDPDLIFIYPMDLSKTPLLSICIPTYNRPKDVEHILQSLIPQLTDEVELVIADGSTNTQTKEIFERLLGQHSHHKFIVRGENVGYDGAIVILIEKATGKYIWFFGDDDEIHPGAIAKVLELIKKFPEIAFMWANFDYATVGHNAVVRDEGFFKDRNEVLSSLGLNLTLLSTSIFKRDEIQQTLPKTKKLIAGSAFAALVPVFEALAGSGKFYFLKGPYVLYKPQTLDEMKHSMTKTGEIKNIAFDAYGVHFLNIVKEYESKFDSQVVKKILTNNFSTLWRGMLVGWAGGWDTPRGKRLRMFKLYWSYPECWIALPLFLLPTWLIKLMYRTYKLFFSHRKLKIRL